LVNSQNANASAASAGNSTTNEPLAMISMRLVQV
jgi:hypothetical protein